MFTNRLAFSLATVIFVAVGAFGQVTTGTPPFGSFGGGPFDSVNLGNLNVHFSIPVVNKAGRGMPFTYALSYDSSVWAQVTTNGITSWSPTNNWGWHADTEVATGYVSYNSSSISCNPRLGEYRYTWTGFVYHDPFGTSHNILGYAELDDCSSANNRNLVGGAVDGSGYTVSFYVDGSGTNQVTSRNGSVITPPYGLSTGAATATDANGNHITADGTGKFYDTLSSTTPVLTVAGTSPKTFTYTGPSGSEAYTMNYGSYNVKTSFGCSGVSEYTGTVPLVSSIVLPDTSKYSFTYETLGGYYTGRLASVTMPTGGTISYTYTGANKGLVCADGSTLGLTRTTPDSSTAWTYARAGSGTAWTTTVNDPLGDKTSINFSKDSATTNPTNNFYETQRLVYQGTSTLLLTLLNCYNNNLTNCATQAVASPISQVDTYPKWPNGSQSHSQIVYDSVSGLLTAENEYDYGGAKLRNTTIAYTNLGSVGYRPTCVQVTAGTVPSSCGTMTSDTVSATTYSNYDSAGNVKTVKQWLSGSNWLSRGFSYTTAGLIQTVTDVNNAQTTYTYAANNNCPVNSFPSSVAEPLSLSRSMTWDCNGGVPVTAKDENQKQTTYSYDLMWRMTDIKLPDGGETKTAYNATSIPPDITVNHLIDSSNRWLTTQTNLDGIGRVIQKQLTSDPNGTSYVDTTYDALGRVASTSNPYYTSGDPTYGITSYAYDALNRTTTITNPDNSTLIFAYTGAATEVEDPGSNSGGTTRVKKIYQSDGLGRPISVCEVSSVNQLGGSGAYGACGQDIAANGFLTSYAYDALGNLRQVTQPGLYYRWYAYDGLSRVTQQASPEFYPAVTYYSYDTQSAGDIYQRVAPAPNQTGSGTVTTTYTHDQLHRLTQTAYNDGTTPTTIFQYDQSSVIGQSLSNGLGRLTYATSDAPLAGTAFSYDSMGRVVNQWQCTPLKQCGTASIKLQFTYDYLGDMTSLENVDDPNLQYNPVTWSYGYDQAARLTGVTSNWITATHPATLLTVNSYNPLGEVQQATLGDGNVRNLHYDTRGRLSSQSDGNFHSIALGYAPDSDILTATDSVNGSWSYSYDDFNRLSTSGCTSHCPNGTASQGFQYLYDQYGNRWQQNLTAGSGPAPQFLFNSKNQISGSGVTYDAAGNMTADGLGNTFAYDGENRLWKWYVNGVYSGGYLHDAFNRVVEENLGTAVDYTYDLGGHVIWSFNSSNGLPAEVYAGSAHVATESNVVNTTNTTYFDYGDWLSTVRDHTQYLVTNPVETCASLPFGDGLSCTGTAPDALNFTDQPAEPYGTARFLFRHYSPTQGRWLTPDPADVAAVDPSNPQTWNRYAYVTNNPVSNTDPLGLFCLVDSCDPDGGSGGSGGPGDPSGPPSGPCDPIAFPGTCNPGAVVPPGVRGDPGGGRRPANNGTQKPCPAVPAHPANANVNSNIATTNFVYYANWLNPPTQAAFTDAWLVSQVRPNGPWDYKTQGQQYDAFGNFNFGATGGAAGIPLQVLQAGAGAVSTLVGTNSSQYGSWYQPPLYGHAPIKSDMIAAGYAYYQQGCK